MCRPSPCSARPRFESTHVKPAVLLIEYSSEDGTKERDRTPFEGKFWIYERAIQGAYYAIFVVETGELEVHKLLRGNYRRLAPNQRGHFQIEPLGVNLGVWRGLFYNETAPWLRWYDDDGNLLPLSDERAELAWRIAEQERRKAEQEHRNAEQERRNAEQERRNAEVQQQRTEQLEAKLRELGIDPATVGRDSTLVSEQS
jgi:Putative restriction endonuclease